MTGETAALYRSGQAREQAGDPVGAMALYRQVIAADPDHVPAMRSMARLSAARGRPREAAALAMQALKVQPGNADLYAELAEFHFRAGEMNAALAANRREIALAPQRPDGYAHLSIALRALGRREEAERALRHALTLDPNHAIALNNLGNLMKDKGDWDEANSCYRRAFRSDRKLAAAAYNLAIGLLMKRQWAEGFDAYEQRWNVPTFPGTRRTFRQRLWQGERVRAGMVAIWAEQGIGDQIMHAGLYADAARASDNLVIVTTPRLVTLLARSFPDLAVTAAIDEGDPRIAAQLPAGSLPRLFRRTDAQFPTRTDYLAADPVLTQRLRARYRALGEGPIVGIAWHSSNARLGRAKSVALLDWAPILAARPAVFVDLQYDDRSTERAAVKERLGIALHRDDDIDPLGELDPVAAQTRAVDLVISVSNTVVHFAGAQSKPVWTLLPRGAGLLWYWGLEGEAVPWYPTMRLLRQEVPGDWRPAIAEAAGRLARWQP